MTSLATKVKLLPYPYQSNCRDYLITENLTQESCIEQCVITRQHNVTKRRVVGSYLVTNKLIGKFEYTQIFGIYRQCNSTCSHVACYYKFDELHRFNQFKAKSPPGTITVYPSYLGIESYFSPKQSFTQFILLLTGVLGLWLGFDMISIWDSFRLYFRKWKKFKLRLWRLGIHINQQSIEIRIMLRVNLIDSFLNFCSEFTF